jgi:hypothetical protein
MVAALLSKECQSQRREYDSGIKSQGSGNIGEFVYVIQAILTYKKRTITGLSDLGV